MIKRDEWTPPLKSEGYLDGYSPQEIFDLSEDELKEQKTDLQLLEALKLLEDISDNEYHTVSRIAEKAGYHRVTASQHLNKRLLPRGFVEKNPNGYGFRRSVGLHN